jgi:signal transduction histidine kinase
MKPRGWDCFKGAISVSRIRGDNGVKRLILQALIWLSACVALPASPAQADGPVSLLRSAEFVLSSSDTPPPETASWQQVTLPDNWNLSRPGVGGFGWYRLTFDLPRRTDSLHAIYVRKLSMNAGFYVNGNYIGDGGRFEEPVARHWNRPQFFLVPPGELVAGRNTVHVRLYGYPNSRAGLGEIEVGPEALLRPDYERRLFIQTTLPQLCNIVVAALGLFTFALWVRRRAESTHVIFFVFSVLWAFRSTHMYVRDIPVSTFAWDIWVQSSFGWCALLFIVLAMRYSHLKWPRFEKLLIAYGVLGPVVMYAAGPERLHAVANNWSFVIVPVAIVFEGFLIRTAWRERTWQTSVLATVWGLIILSSVHDGLVHRDKLAFDSFYAVSYVMILLCVVMGWGLIDRFVQALNTAERLNRELEQRVAEKHAELEQNFARLQQMQKEHAVAEERQRMMSEMHDGLGSQLIAALDLAEHSEVSRTEIAGELRECLDTLRITIDSLEPTENDLLTVLGNLRYRLEGRLKRKGIALDWQVRDVPQLESLTPQNVLHVLRIVQEAFTNVIKHAHARTITVQTGYTDEQVFLRITDDGRGFCRGREGRGLVNMRNRARALAASLEILPSPSGTTLSLYLAR